MAWPDWPWPPSHILRQIYAASYNDDSTVIRRDSTSHGRRTVVVTDALCVYNNVQLWQYDAAPLMRKGSQSGPEIVKRC